MRGATRAVVLVLLAPLCSAPPLPQLTWALAGLHEILDASLDATGSVLVAGYRNGSVPLAGVFAGSNSSEPARGPQDATLAKLSPDGRLDWLVTLGGAGGGMATAVDAGRSTEGASPAGTLAACGFLSSVGGQEATFGTGPAAPKLFGRGNRDAFVVKVGTRPPFPCPPPSLRRR